MTASVVSAARPGDVLAVAGLLAEMDRFYGAGTTGSLKERERQIHEVLFADPPAAHVLLARDGDQLTGLAAYSFLWPAVGLTRALFLKELYVAEACRWRGVGTLLMRAVMETASRHRCSRVEWTTGRDNSGAQAFYAMLGLPVYPSKIFYRIEDTGAGFPVLG